MSKEPRPRYHNSPQPPKKRWKMSPRFEEILVQSWVCTFIVLTSPVWIPLFLVLLPFRTLREGLQHRLIEKRRARAALNPKPAPRLIDSELERRRAIAKRKREITPLKDPISDDPAYSWAIKEANRRAGEEIGGYKQMGDCHRIWRRQKQILKDEFGIEWFTPSEMNPHIIFD
jgi:hypothetical protein